MESRHDELRHDGRSCRRAPARDRRSGTSRGSGGGTDADRRERHGGRAAAADRMRAIGAGARTARWRWAGSGAEAALALVRPGRRRVRGGRRPRDDDRDGRRLATAARPRRRDLGASARGHTHPLPRDEREPLGSGVARASVVPRQRPRVHPSPIPCAGRPVRCAGAQPAGIAVSPPSIVKQPPVT